MTAALPEIVVPDELSRLSTLIEERPEVLATGGEDLRLAALHATKHVFDIALKSEAQSIRHITELLAGLSPTEAPQTRSQAKRKRSPSPPTPAFTMLKPTPLHSLFVDGMDEDQIWAQLELRTQIICDTLEYALEATGEDIEDEESEADEKPTKRARLESMADEAGDDSEDDVDDFEGLEDMSSAESEDEDLDENNDEDGDQNYSEESDEDLGESVTELRDPSSEEEDGPPTLFSKIQSALKKKEKTKKRSGHPELDDDFFSLAEFNAESERAEARKVSRGRLGGLEEDEDEEAEEDDIDLFKALDGDVEVEGNEEEPMYKDFFDPPPRSGKGKSPDMKRGTRVRFHDEVRVKNIKSRGKGVPVSTLSLLGPKAQILAAAQLAAEGQIPGTNVALGSGEDAEVGDENDDDDDDDDKDEDEEDEDEGEEGEDVDDDEVDGEDEDNSAEDENESQMDDLETMERFRDDLFAEDDDAESETDLTTHQRRQAELRRQIKELEAENVGKKDWTLMGEATARSRPQNSLLEEDLEFERVMKSVPVVTQDIVQKLEDRIKARIIASEFDDVVRRRPVDDKPFLPSRLFELQDTKSKQSLAEIYEDEYMAAQTGGVAGEDRDAKLQQEHEEITRMWEGICYKLDALCNAHFTPKQPKATISTVSNVAAATMESALPTASATRTMLAPEEVFAPTSTDLRARSELTPVEKRALHNKQKKAKRKARDALASSVDKFATKGKGIRGVKQQKEEALKNVVKHGKGVTVVGKQKKETLGNKRGQT